ncbi:hypothetical protein PILCRDRAFT_13378 [Piloderma croceum F 1598]|uniref:Uncharacterized protein n=1 Tax=Piloderma croceum (strain F 1598) TaxID=765440 RepID=A0A0C3BEJ1_PILCF|nr:hypothetical protein PILCRDRAFT_13378 [Piloderma croceum F 1598]
MATTTSIVSLQYALRGIRVIESRISGTGGRLTKQVFAQGQIGDATLDTIRDSVGLNFQSVVLNVRTLKQNDSILQQYPDIRRNWEASISCCNSLTHESFTPAPIQWDHVADSVYDDLPVMKSSIIAALRASGIANP